MKCFKVEGKCEIKLNFSEKIHLPATRLSSERNSPKMTKTGCLLFLCDVWLFENSWKSTIMDKLLQKFIGILFVHRGLTLIYSSFLASGPQKEHLRTENTNDKVYLCNESLIVLPNPRNN